MENKDKLTALNRLTIIILKSMFVFIYIFLVCISLLIKYIRIMLKKYYIAIIIILAIIWFLYI